MKKKSTLTPLTVLPPVSGPIKIMNIGLRPYLCAWLIVLLLSLGACSNNSLASINGELLDFLNDDRKNIPVNSIMPPEWEMLCFVFLPYAPQNQLEREFGGRFGGRFETATDAELMIVGRDRHGRLYQVVLGPEVSGGFVIQRRAQYVCGSRESVIGSVMLNGKKHFHLENS